MIRACPDDQRPTAGFRSVNPIGRHPSYRRPDAMRKASQIKDNPAVLINMASTSRPTSHWNCRIPPHWTQWTSRFAPRFSMVGDTPLHYSQGDGPQSGNDWGDENIEPPPNSWISCSTVAEALTEFL